MEEKILLNAVLVFPLRGSEVLLAKKMHKIGAGCWNGYGGGIEHGETEQEAATRELLEESGLFAQGGGLEKVALIDFHNQKSDGSLFTCRGHIYFAHTWRGQPTATDEMQNPTWFETSTLPLIEMMPADRDWLPLVLQGKKIHAQAWYGPFQKQLLRPTVVREVGTFD